MSHIPDEIKDQHGVTWVVKDMRRPLLSDNPSAELIEALYGPYISSTADASRRRAWREMINVAKRERLLEELTQ